MVREEIWSVPLERAEAFFRAQPDVVREPPGGFRFETCRISLTALASREMGIWSACRVKLRMEGEREALEGIHHRLLIRFLTAGG